MGEGKFPTVEFAIPDKEGQMDVFLEKFAHADNMWIKFKKGSEKPCKINMDGSRGIINAYKDCLSKLPKDSQPFDNNPGAKDDDKVDNKKGNRDA
jgi:hypothetical protein